MKVTFIIIAYNAENTIKSLIKDLERQNYNHKLIEVILVDSNSSDNTKKIMIDFKNKKSQFYRICILDNNKKILPCGWNIALKEATGDIILRVDAHTSIPNDFIKKNVECISNGEKICGGKVVSIVDSDNEWQKTLLLAENSALGGGIATFRRGDKKRYVSTLAFAAYKKEVFDNVGEYNEYLVRTEDNEMHYRMKKAGYKFYFNPEINSKRFARSSLRKMIKQKFLNGYWIGLTLRIQPKCFSLYHFIPLIFVLAIIITLISTIFMGNLLVNILFISYISINLLLSIFSIVNKKFNSINIMLPVFFFLIHFSYGLGTLIGIIQLPFWNKVGK